MKLAVAYENGQVFQHFGKSEQFKIYTIEDKRIVSSEVVGTNGNGHGALAGFLKELRIDTVICGGIGGGARDMLSGAGITVYPGVRGDADVQAQALLDGTLAYDPDTACNHHHDGGHEHNCGGHAE